MSQDFVNTLSSKLPEIARDFGTPCHVYDEAGIRKTLEFMKGEAEKCGVKNFKEFFAVKALPVPAILRIVKEYGFGFDCSSEVEVILAREAGARPEDIMFTSNNTKTAEFELALSEGGCILNLDDVSFLYHSIWDSMEFPETICFRVNPGDLLKGDGAQLSMSGSDAKYGIMVSQINEAYQIAQEKGAKTFGMHTMVCSNDLEYRHMVDTIEVLVDFAFQLKKDTNIDISFINIGGGMGIPYRPGQEPFDMGSLLRWMGIIQKGLPFDLKIYMESGRYVTGPHGALVNRAINKKEIYQEYVGVQTAMPGLMRPAIYGAYHHITVHDGLSGEQKEDALDCSVSIVGDICENCDRLTDEPRVLPFINTGEIDGDFVVTWCCGAHAAAMGFNYNGRPRPGAVMIRSDNSVVRVVRPETVEHLLGRTDGL